jgi:hypothetical protein
VQLPRDGLGELWQRLLMYFGIFAFWGVVLLGLQAIFVPDGGRTTEDFVVMALCAAVAVVFGMTHRVRKWHSRQAALRPTGELSRDPIIGCRPETEGSSAQLTGRAVVDDSTV